MLRTLFGPFLLAVFFTAHSIAALPANPFDVAFLQTDRPLHTKAAVGDAATTLPVPLPVTGGLLQGVPGRNAAVTVFKGIPYAAPPLGDLRLRKPSPVKPWSGVSGADHFSKLCPQRGARATRSEDCLYANLWAGAKVATELPSLTSVTERGDHVASTTIAPPARIASGRSSSQPNRCGKEDAFYHVPLCTGRL